MSDVLTVVDVEVGLTVVGVDVGGITVGREVEQDVARTASPITMTYLAFIVPPRSLARDPHSHRPADLRVVACQPLSVIVRLRHADCQGRMSQSGETQGVAQAVSCNDSDGARDDRPPRGQD